MKVIEGEDTITVGIDIKIIPDKEYAHLIEVWEPLSVKAPNPNLAQPYCCYGNTVIFYFRPYVIRPWHHFLDLQR
jgi:hypothetical protein